MKKVKLFTTIASLCLAVALMAFGVYAAASVTAKVSGTISFGATTANVELVEVVYTVTNGKVDDAAVTDKKVTMSPGADADAGKQVGSLGNVVVTDIAQACTIEIKATFKNVSNAIDAVIKATTAGAVTAEDNLGYTLSVSTLADVELKAVASKDATATYTITFTLNVTDNTQTVSGINYSAEFTAQQA